MFKLKKQPGETIVGVSIDFSARLAVSETLLSGGVVGSLIDGTETDPIVIVDDSFLGKSVVATVSGGTSGCSYKLTYTAVGSLGNILESEIKMTVVDL